MKMHSSGMSRRRVVVAAIATVIGLFGLAVPSGSAAEGDDITYEMVRETYSVPFKTEVRKTSKLKKGVTQVAQRGHTGIVVRRYRVAILDDVEIGRSLVARRVVRTPEKRIVLKGTKTASPAAPSRDCDPNYGGQCVPIASDVDCGGGSGNGPAYVYGMVTVIGYDIYDLDRDGDGYGCD